MRRLRALLATALLGLALAAPAIAQDDHACPPPPPLPCPANPFGGIAPPGSVCLHGRYAVSVSSIDRQSVGVSLGPESSGGYFWTYEPNNPEVFVKVLTGGCAVNGRVWFFAGGMTTTAAFIAVQDMFTGAFKVYAQQEPNVPFQTVIDLEAFECQP